MTGAGNFEIAAILHLSESKNPKIKNYLQMYIYFALDDRCRDMREQITAQSQ